MALRRRLPITHPNLGCYYKGPKQQLGRYPQLGQTGLEVAAASELLSGIKSFFSGLFGKDPNKSNYDKARELIWREFGNLVNQYGPRIDNGTATKSEAQTAIEGAEEFRRQWTALYEQYRTQIESSWIDPRFGEIDSFMGQVITSWRTKLPSLSGFLMPRSFSDLATTGSSLAPWILGAGVLFLLNRR